VISSIKEKLNKLDCRWVCLETQFISQMQRLHPPFTRRHQISHFAGERFMWFEISIAGPR